MSNQTYMSQRQKLASKQVVAKMRRGEWPPVGYQWAALAALPSEVLDQFFRGPVWLALSEGLSQISDHETDRLVNVADLNVARESRGILWLAKDLQKLPDEMSVIKDAEKELVNVAQ